MSSLPETSEVFARSEQLYTSRQVDQAITDMAGEINAALAGAQPVVLPVMNGGLVLAGKLLTQLEFPLRLDYVHATRYRDQTRGSSIAWRVSPEVSLQGQTVLILDDILDAGLTLQAIVAHCLEAGAARIYTAVLVEKMLTDADAALAADFVGLTVPDRYVFGSGMDFKGYWRNAAGIYAIDGY